MNNVIKYGLSNTPFGRCFYAKSSEGVCSIQFTKSEKAAFEELSQYWSGYIFIRDDNFAQKQLSDIFTDNKPQEVHVKGTEFQKTVWRALQNIPFAKLATYSDIATYIGRPKAVRAVASAIANNRVAYLIPCHRIIRKNGDIGEFRWGKEIKKQIIEWEKQNNLPTILYSQKN